MNSDGDSSPRKNPAFADEKGFLKGAPVKGLRQRGISDPFYALVRLQLKIEYGRESISEKLGLGRDKKRYAYLFLGLFLMAFGSLFALMFRIADVLASGFVSIGQPGVPVVLALMGAQVVVVLFALSHLMSTLYYSDDLETLKGLPLKPWMVMSSKVFCVYLGELLLSGFITVPTFITLGSRIQVACFWLTAVLTFLMVPAIPVGLCLLIVALLMRYTARSKRRDFFRVLFGLVFFVFILGFQYVNVNMAKYGPEYLMQLLTQKNSLIQVMTAYYPPARWAALGLTSETFFTRLSGFLLYSLVSAGFLALTVSVSQVWFFEGVTREVGKSAKKVTGVRVSLSDQSKVLHTVAKTHSPVAALISKEIKTLVRNPTFFLTALLNLLVFPLIIFMGQVAGASDFRALLDFIEAAGGKDLFLLIVVGIHGAIVALNQVASTGISREGPLFSISKQIPVSPWEQVKAKLGFSMIYAFLETIIMVMAIWFAARPDPADVLIILCLGVLVSWPVSAIGLLIDLYQPKLNWTQPNEAMKGNFTTMISGLAGVVYIVVAGLFTWLFILMGLGRPWLFLVPAVFIAATGMLLNEFLESSAQKRYMQIEI